MHTETYGVLSPIRDSDLPLRTRYLMRPALDQLSIAGWNFMCKYRNINTTSPLEYAQTREWLLRGALELSAPLDRILLLSLVIKMEANSLNLASHLALRARALLEYGKPEASVPDLLSAALQLDHYLHTASSTELSTSEDRRGRVTAELYHLLRAAMQQLATMVDPLRRLWATLFGCNLFPSDTSPITPLKKKPTPIVPTTPTETQDDCDLAVRNLMLAFAHKPSDSYAQAPPTTPTKAGEKSVIPNLNYVPYNASLFTSYAQAPPTTPTKVSSPYQYCAHTPKNFPPAAPSLSSTFVNNYAGNPDDTKLPPLNAYDLWKDRLPPNMDAPSVLSALLEACKEIETSDFVDAFPEISALPLSVETTRQTREDKLLQESGLVNCEFVRPVVEPLKEEGRNEKRIRLRAKKSVAAEKELWKDEDVNWAPCPCLDASSPARRKPLLIAHDVQFSKMWDRCRALEWKETDFSLFVADTLRLPELVLVRKLFEFNSAKDFHKSETNVMMHWSELDKDKNSKGSWKGHEAPTFRFASLWKAWRSLPVNFIDFQSFLEMVSIIRINSNLLPAPMNCSHTALALPRVAPYLLQSTGRKNANVYFNYSTQIVGERTRLTVSLVSSTPISEGDLLVLCTEPPYGCSCGYPQFHRNYAKEMKE